MVTNMVGMAATSSCPSACEVLAYCIPGRLNGAVYAVRVLCAVYACIM